MLDTNKLFYTIGEVANEFNIAPSTIRFWESKFEFIRPKEINGKGERRYTTKDIEKLRSVYYLLVNKGMTIEGAAKILKHNKGKAVLNVNVINELEQLKADLTGIEEELNQFKTDN